jgi:hypothetical protein
MSTRPGLASEISAALVRLPAGVRVPLGLSLTVGALFIMFRQWFEGVPAILAAALYLPVILAVIALMLFCLYRIGRWLFARR